MSATEQTGESATGGGELQRAVPTPFLTKTYQLVDDPAVDDLISWNEDGSAFIIWQPAEFARDLLPKYFKHNNLSSFVRQLNTYGFRKVVPDRWEFANDCFKKGEKELLRDIQRRKMTLLTASATSPVVALSNAAQVAVQVMQTCQSNSGDEQAFSSNSLAGGKQAEVKNCSTPDLVEENERLKKENQQMTNELSHLRGLCSNIFTMMSNFGSPGQQDPENPSIESKQLDLFQSERFSEEQGGSSGGNAGAMDASKLKECEESASPKLFGALIGCKRVKRSDDNESDRRKHPNQQWDETDDNSQSYAAHVELKLELSQSGPSCS